MKRIIFTLLVSFFVWTSYAEEHLTSDQLQELLSSLKDDPVYIAAQKDSDILGIIDLYCGDSELEQRILSNLMSFVESVFIGNNFNSDYAFYSAKMQQAEKDYVENLDHLHPHSVLRWLCPYFLAIYYYMNSTDVELAISYIKKSDEFIQSLSNGRLSIQHTCNMIILAKFYIEKERFKDAIDLVTAEMSELDKLNHTDSYTYAQLESTLADIYYGQYDFLNAKNHLNNVLSIYKKLGAGESFLAYEAYGSLALCYAYLGDDDSLLNALECLINAQEILNITGREDSDILLEASMNRLYVYFLLDLYDLILDEIPDVLILATNKIVTKIPLMSESERYEFWTNEMEGLYSTILPIVSYISETGSMSYNMYLALLQSRGLLLNCNNNFTSFIASSEDETVKEEQNKLISLKSEYTRAKSDSPINKDLLSQLRTNISQLEHSLLTYIREHNNDILSWMDVSIEDIKAELKENELAVEFLSIPLVDGPHYCALVLNNDTTVYPTYIDLLSEEQFNSFKVSQTEISDSIWSKIIDIYPNTTKLYFAPCGEMYNFPIELCINNENIPTQFSAVRLSSTREIVLNRKNRSDKVALLGGFNYNQSLRSIIDETQKYSIFKLPEPDIPNMDEETSSGIYKPLPGANIEVHDLSLILGNQNVKRIYGAEGIETAFKDLSGDPYKIIHIATHGFYNNHGNNPRTAMDNCGLVFSGVNTLENIDILPQFVEDGKLTASEIANLDLWGTDLVCLSACSSGKSSVSSEGAYGLQRGFKLAGVNSIIMSLWDINDVGPTNLMMKSFYKYYIESNDKLLSYQNAVRDVREEYPDFKDWASFIIIDAL